MTTGKRPSIKRMFEKAVWKRTGELPSPPARAAHDRDWCDTKRSAAQTLRSSLAQYIADLVRETGARQGPRCKHLHGGAKYVLREGDERMARGEFCLATGDYVSGIRWAGAAAACVRTDASCPAPGAINVVKYGRE